MSTTILPPKLEMLPERTLGLLGSRMEATVRFLRTDIPGQDNSTLVKVAKYALSFFLFVFLTASIVGAPLVIWAAKEVTEQRFYDRQKSRDAGNEKVVQESHEKVVGIVRKDGEKLLAGLVEQDVVMVVNRVFTDELIKKQPSAREKLLQLTEVSEKDNEIAQLKRMYEKLEGAYDAITKSGTPPPIQAKTLAEAQEKAKELEDQLEVANEEIALLREQLHKRPSASETKISEGEENLEAQLLAAQKQVKSLQAELADKTAEAKSHLKALDKVVAERNEERVKVNKELKELKTLRGERLLAETAKRHPNLMARPGTDELAGLVSDEILRGDPDRLKKIEERGKSLEPTDDVSPPSTPADNHEEDEY